MFGEVVALTVQIVPAEERRHDTSEQRVEGLLALLLEDSQRYHHPRPCDSWSIKHMTVILTANMHSMNQIHGGIIP